MKKISKDLEVAKSRKESVMDACRQVNAESSAVMLLCLQLDDLEQHFEGIQKVLEDRVKENVERERLLEEKSRRFLAEEQRLGLLQEEIRRREAELEILETRIKECAAECIRKGRESARLSGLLEEVHMKEEELGVMEKRVKDCEDDLVRSRQALDQCMSVLKDRRIEEESVSRLLEECCQEYDQKNSEVEVLLDRAAKLEVITNDYVSKKDKLDSINVEIEKKVFELEAKEKQHEVFQNSIKDQLAAFDVRKQEFESLECSKRRIEGEVEAKECELVKATQCLEELDKEMEAKNYVLASVQGSISGLSESLEVKKGELATICCKIEKHNIDLAKKEKELESIRVRTKYREEDLLLKEKKAASLRKTTREYLNDLEKKKSELNFLNESLIRSTEDVEYRKSELKKIRQESVEYRWELEQREERLDFLQASLNEQCKALEMNERIFEEKVRDFEQRQRQLLSREKLREDTQEAGLMARSGTIVHQGQVEVGQSDNIPPGGSQIMAPVCSTVTRTGRNTPHDESRIRKPYVLDPLTVLGIIQGSLEQLKSCRDAGSGDDIHRRHIYLLEQMTWDASPLPEGVKEQALGIARGWESKLRTKAESRLEALGFLCLLDRYKLASFFDRRNTTKLSEAFSLHKSHPRLCQAVGLADTNAVPSPSCSRPHGESKRPLAVSSARSLQPRQKQQVAHSDRS